MGLLTRFRYFWANHHFTTGAGILFTLFTLYNLVFIAIPQHATGGINSLITLLIGGVLIVAALWGWEDAKNFDSDTKEYSVRRIIMYICLGFLFAYLAYLGWQVQTTSGIR